MLGLVSLNGVWRKLEITEWYVFILSYYFREVDWLFSSDAGRLQLAESAAVERLVVVTMHRGHTYSSLEQVKEEVSAKAVELIQSGLPPGKKVSA